MNKNEQLIRKVAKKMQDNNTFLTINSTCFEHVFMPAARIAVEHMAEQYEEGYRFNFKYAKDSFEDCCHYEMVERGLIPPIEEQSEVEPENRKL